MSETIKTLAMRIEWDAEPAAEADATRILRTIDPHGTVTVDAETGIAHVGTVREALDVEDVLTKAGFSVGAATG